MFDDDETLYDEVQQELDELRADSQQDRYWLEETRWGSQ